MDYEDAEQAGRDGQEEHGRPTLAQWARAQALTAVMAQQGAPRSMGNIADLVSQFAELIVTGGLPS